MQVVELIIVAATFSNAGQSFIYSLSFSVLEISDPLKKE